MEIYVISNVRPAAVMQVVYKIQVIVCHAKKDTMDLNVTKHVIPVSTLFVIKMVNANMGVWMDILQ